jgi:diacylglycerol kinase (CTP)
VLYLYSIQADPLVIRNNLFLFFLFVCSNDALRFAVPSFNELYIKVLGFLMRKSEHYERVNGVIWYLAGCIGVLSIFPMDIAALSIVILSWCDTAASFAGRMYGDYTYRFQNGKSLAGTMGAIAVGVLAAAVFWGGLLNHDNNPTPSWRPESSSLSLPLLALLTGIIGGASELIDVWDLDDNLIIPLAAGSMLWLTLIGLGLGSSGVVAAQHS